ncbi:MAG: hypothetical protein WC817_02735 [Patescibacteria group bacterium]|jgi:hypothetical protein
MHKKIVILLLIVGFLALGVSLLLKTKTQPASQDSDVQMLNTEEQSELQNMTQSDSTSDISQDLGAAASVDDVNTMLTNVDADLQKL